MKFNAFLLSMPEDEVRAAMQEEDCERCFGCPPATVAAAGLTRLSSILMRQTFDSGGREDNWTDERRDEITGIRSDLHMYTDNCTGVTDSDRRSRSVAICQSPYFE
jgi:hypothetical protein